MLHLSLKEKSKYFYPVMSRRDTRVTRIAPLFYILRSVVVYSKLFDTQSLLVINDTVGLKVPVWRYAVAKPIYKTQNKKVKLKPR